MNTQIVAVLISEGTKLVGQWFRNRPIRIETVQKTTEQVSTLELSEEKATEVATGCVPCAIGHLGTGSGVLNEAVRFAKTDGMSSNEVIDRVGMCLDELNAMERIDLRPEMINNLPEWEKELADEVLIASRSIRHSLEALETAKSLEEAAGTMQTLRTHIWREWIKRKMKNLTPEEKNKIQQRVVEKLDELESDEEEE